MEAKRNTDPIEEMIRQAGREEAPRAFTEDVMDRIQALPKPISKTRPLISANLWGWILLWAGSLAVGGLLIPKEGEGGSPFWRWALETSASLSGEGISLPELPVSFAYCGAALLVFALLHLLWMRKYMRRELAF